MIFGRDQWEFSIQGILVRIELIYLEINLPWEIFFLFLSQKPRKIERYSCSRLETRDWMRKQNCSRLERWYFLKRKINYFRKLKNLKVFPPQNISQETSKKGHSQKFLQELSILVLILKLQMKNEKLLFSYRSTTHCMIYKTQKLKESDQPQYFQSTALRVTALEGM